MIDYKKIENYTGFISSSSDDYLRLNCRLCVDTRSYKAGQAFLAITGEKYNALSYLDGVLSLGCPLVFYTSSKSNINKVEEYKEKFSKTCFVETKDSITFLQEITKGFIRTWNQGENRLLTISGSNGKTTTKEMISYVLEKVFPSKVVKTLANNNNHIGVPLTILDIKEETKVLILELGSNHPGEIKTLCDIADPNLGITTNIGRTHLEFFGSIAAVFDEESYLFDYIKKNTRKDKLFLKNCDDDYLSKIENENFTVSYGESADTKFEFSKNKINLISNGKEICIENKFITGKHNFINLAVAFIYIHNVFPEIEVKDLIKHVGTFVPTDNRSQWIEKDQTKIFLDAYNANPSSMIVAIESFKDFLSHENFNLSDSLLILGDMNELGDFAEQGHKDVATISRDLGFSNFRALGRYAAYYESELSEQKFFKFDSAQSYIEERYKNDLKSFKYIFIKGSRSLQLESLIDIT
ncbi:MAG: UDP-N-acetylmuramoyl-tripeptide--D-alanyl-D-alanine ligase [Thermoproteota archaeon]|jgi:UDP-N-acetylmuramoyl-tripeptide--D-alanyl-D-alanine ligase